MRIGIDIDNVVSETVPALLPTMNKTFRIKLCPKDIYMYNFHTIIGVSDEKMKKMFWENTIISKLFMRAGKVNGAIRAINLIKKLGNEVIFVTDRPSKYMGITRKWMEKCGIENPNIVHMIGGMGGKHKYAEFRAIHGEGFNMFIEDRLEDAILIKEHNPNMKVVLLKRPWNKTENAERSLIIVNSWKEILRLL